MIIIWWLLFNRLISQKQNNENTKFQKVIIQDICLVVQVNQYVQHAELAQYMFVRFQARTQRKCGVRMQYPNWVNYLKMTQF